MTSYSVQAFQDLLGDVVLERLSALQPPVLTLDFDGQVLGTRRLAEGTAVAFNARRKGQLRRARCVPRTLTG